MKKFYQLALIMSAMLISACQSSKPALTRTKLIREISDEWDRGNFIAKEGSCLVHKGEKMIDRGKNEIHEGNKIMRKCELAFQEYDEEAKIHELDDG